MKYGYGYVSENKKTGKTSAERNIQHVTSETLVRRREEKENHTKSDRQIAMNDMDTSPSRQVQKGIEKLKQKMSYGTKKTGKTAWDILIVSESKQ